MIERALVQEDVRGFLVRHAESGVIIDEAQNVPELSPYLQGQADRAGEMGRFILSGSQNYLMMERITQSLSGRVALLTVFPFACNELAAAGITGDLYERLQKGMYPAIYDREIDPVDYYSSYLQSYVERDVRALRNVGDLTHFVRFLQLCAGRIGQLVNHSSLANDLGIDHKTMKSWMFVLEASYVIFTLGPHHLRGALFENYLSQSIARCDSTRRSRRTPGSSVTVPVTRSI